MVTLKIVNFVMELNTFSNSEGLLNNEKCPMFNISPAILFHRKLFLLSVISSECTKLVSFKGLYEPVGTTRQ